MLDDSIVIIVYTGYVKVYFAVKETNKQTIQ